MNKNFCTAAFAVGLAAVAWVAYGYLGSNTLALTMTLLIATFYVTGASELRRFDQATATLRSALTALTPPSAQSENPTHLGDWLRQVHPALQNPVRLRIEGERVALPGPALTPYLVGLLVLLGMLGTFLGMVVTLNGAVMALESTTDLATIRNALAAPVKGLGLAFGTSVAGVAASAMLGLMSALCRRERLQAAQLLDTAIAGSLRVFSRAHQRQETLKALQLQARVLPEMTQHLQSMMVQMESQNGALNAQMLDNQNGFHRHALTVYSELAVAVDGSLKKTLAESVVVAAAAMQPVVAATMAGLAQESSALRASLAHTVQAQLDSVTAQLGAAATALQTDLAVRDERRLAAFSLSLDAMAISLYKAWQAAGAQMLDQQTLICKTLEDTARGIQAQAQAHASETLAEMAGLVQSVAEAPRAAAEMMGELRSSLSDSLVRDNAMLEERSRILGNLSTLLDTVQQGSNEQRGAIDTLVAQSASLLQAVGTQFTAKVDAESAKMAAVATQITGGALEVASLGEAFGFGVQLFSSSNESLIVNLQRIENALDKSMLRSDEQLAYYVAQAREIIDLSTLSQKQIVEDLQQLASKRLASNHDTREAV